MRAELSNSFGWSKNRFILGSVRMGREDTAPLSSSSSINEISVRRGLSEEERDEESGRRGEFSLGWSVP
jgi:hypothetical protein